MPDPDPEVQTSPLGHFAGDSDSSEGSDASNGDFDYDDEEYVTHLSLNSHLNRIVLISIDN